MVQFSVASVGPPGRGYQFAPSSFLTAGPGTIPLAGSDLGHLMAATGRTAQDEIAHARALPRCAPTPIDSPWSQHAPGFAGLGGPQLSNAPAGVGQYSIHHLSEGTFTEETIRNMHKAVLQAKTDAKWRALMEDIRRKGREAGAVGWKDYLGELRWLDHWFRNVWPIDYVRDPHQVELVKHPWMTLLSRAGDCDDLSATISGGAGALGAPHKFRTYRADPRRPKEWSHVTAFLNVPGYGWVNDDLTIRGAAPGFEPQGFPFKDWPEPSW